MYTMHLIIASQPWLVRHDSCRMKRRLFLSGKQVRCDGESPRDRDGPSSSSSCNFSLLIAAILRYARAVHEKARPTKPKYESTRLLLLCSAISSQRYFLAALNDCHERKGAFVSINVSAIINLILKTGRKASRHKP